VADKDGRSLVLPDGRCDIIVKYNNQEATPPVPIITGPATLPYTIEYIAGDSWLGIRLRPHSAFELWRQRITGAVDTVLRGDDAIALLPDLKQIAHSELSTNSLAKLWLEIKSSSATDKRLVATLELLHVSGGRIRVEELSKRVGCTARQLNRLIKTNTGLTTKTYSQLVQFHRTLELIQAQRFSLTGAALEGGYSDHAHLTRAFKRFGGFTPTTIPADLSAPSLFSA